MRMGGGGACREGRTSSGGAHEEGAFSRTGERGMSVPILEPYSLCPYDWIDCECGSDGEPSGEGDEQGDGCEGDEGRRAGEEERGREGQRSTCHCCSSRALP